MACIPHCPDRPNHIHDDQALRLLADTLPAPRRRTPEEWTALSNRIADLIRISAALRDDGIAIRCLTRTEANAIAESEGL